MFLLQEGKHKTRGPELPVGAVPKVKFPDDSAAQYF